MLKKRAFGTNVTLLLLHHHKAIEKKRYVNLFIVIRTSTENRNDSFFRVYRVITGMKFINVINQFKPEIEDTRSIYPRSFSGIDFEPK